MTITKFQRGLDGTVVMASSSESSDTRGRNSGIIKRLEEAVVNRIAAGEVHLCVACHVEPRV